MTNHPITPPPELVKQWQYEANHNEAMFPQVATQAAQWGSDQELEACCAEMNGWGNIHHSCGLDLSNFLRAARRPKPPTLKEQALKALQFVDEKLDLPLHNHCNAIHTIRRALEALDD
jgi:hypothetical protein